MTCLTPSLRLTLSLASLVVFVSTALADPRVIVTATARTDYTRSKFDGPKVKPETYVFMQGKYFPGHTADPSIDAMSFHNIVEMIAPELARQQFVPTKDPKAAELLIVVHWGVTIPYVSDLTMMARTSAITDTSNTTAGLTKRLQEESDRGIAMDAGADAILKTAAMSAGLSTSADQQLDLDRLTAMGSQISAGMEATGNLSLLGYQRDMRRLGGALFSSEEERTLLSDLTSERYFVILKAYDLHEDVPAGMSRKAVWTVHLNMRSPGIDFKSALGRMSNVAVDFVGRTTDKVSTVRSKLREGKVTIEPVIILGETR